MTRENLIDLSIILEKYDGVTDLAIYRHSLATGGPVYKGTNLLLSGEDHAHPHPL